MVEKTINCYVKRENSLNKWINMPYFWMRRVKMVKTPMLPKLICKFSTKPIRVFLGENLTR